MLKITLPHKANIVANTEIRIIQGMTLFKILFLQYICKSFGKIIVYTSPYHLKNIRLNGVIAEHNVFVFFLPTFSFLKEKVRLQLSKEVGVQVE